MEQGFTRLGSGESVNDACRRVNSEGWDVKQITVYVKNDTPIFGLLVERQPLAPPA